MSLSFERRNLTSVLFAIAAGAFASGCTAPSVEEEMGSSESRVTADEGSQDEITLVRSFAPGRGHWAGVRSAPNGFTPEQSYKIRMKGSRALYACAVNEHNMLSLDPNCEGQRQLGFVGYADNNAEGTRAPLYRCNAGNDHFISTDSNCEGQAQEGLLGWVEPVAPPPPPPAPQVMIVRSFAPGLGHWVSVGSAPPGFTPEVRYAIQSRGNQALFACQVGSHNMLSLDPNCEGQTSLGFIGYADNNAAGTRQALYRCRTGNDHFITTDLACEGATMEGQLGWVDSALLYAPAPPAPPADFGGGY